MLVLGRRYQLLDWTTPLLVTDHLAGSKYLDPKHYRQQSFGCVTFVWKCACRSVAPVLGQSILPIDIINVAQLT